MDARASDPATSRGLQAPRIYRLRASHNSLMFSNSLEQLTELKKVLYLLLQFYYKGYKSGPTKWKRHTVGGLGGSLIQSFLASPRGVSSPHLPCPSVGSSARKLLWASVSRAFTRVLLERRDWLNHWPCDWAQSPVPFPYQRANPLITCLVFLVTSPNPEAIQGSLLSHLISILMSLLSLRKFQQFLNLCTRNHWGQRPGISLFHHKTSQTSSCTTLALHAQTCWSSLSPWTVPCPSLSLRQFPSPSLTPTQLLHPKITWSESPRQSQCRPCISPYLFAHSTWFYLCLSPP